MFDLVTLGFVTVFLLAGYLYFSIKMRLLGEQPQPRSSGLQPTTIDVSTLDPAIKRVRQNPDLKLNHQPHQNKQRSRLITNARALVENLAFFRHRAEEYPQHNN